MHIIELLRRKGAEVNYNDPHVSALAVEYGDDLESIELSTSVLSDADCAVIVTAHSSYDWECVADQANLIVDTRNALCDFHASNKIVRM